MHLEPLDTFYFHNEYLFMVFRIFNKMFHENVSLQIIALPAFSSEFTCGVRKDDNKFIAFKLVAKSQIWRTTEIKLMEEDRGYMTVTKDGKDFTDSHLESLKNEYPIDYDKIGVNEYAAEIDEETHEILCKIWKKMLLATRYPENPGAGLDGVTYIFIMPLELRGRVAGEIWSPASSSNCGRLVEISHLLEEYCSAAKSERENLTTEIRYKAAELNRLWKDIGDGR
jgi:hypothetical protein